MCLLYTDQTLSLFVLLLYIRKFIQIHPNTVESQKSMTLICLTTHIADHKNDNGLCRSGNFFSGD